jgi:hypothetical protein
VALFLEPFGSPVRIEIIHDGQLDLWRLSPVLARHRLRRPAVSAIPSPPDKLSVRGEQSSQGLPLRLKPIIQCMLAREAAQSGELVSTGPDGRVHRAVVRRDPIIEGMSRRASASLIQGVRVPSHAHVAS